MKIVKHIDIEHSTGITDLAGETCQGILTGLISSDDKRLEVTNCFPSARSEVLLENEENTGAAITQDDKQNEVGDMLKRFRFWITYLYNHRYTKMRLWWPIVSPGFDLTVAGMFVFEKCTITKWTLLNFLFQVTYSNFKRTMGKGYSNSTVGWMGWWWWRYSRPNERRGE